MPGGLFSIDLGSKFSSNIKHEGKEEESILSKRGMFCISTRRDSEIEEFKAVRIPKLLYPKSLYGGWQGPLPRCDERRLLAKFKDDSSNAEADPVNEGDFYCYTLREFVVYRAVTASKSPGQLVTLDDVASNVKAGEYVFRLNGILENEDQAWYIEDAQIRDFSVEGFEDTEAKHVHCVRDMVLLQTAAGGGKHGRRSEDSSGVWYRLTTPAPEYQQYFADSLWVLNLSKHVTEYLRSKVGQNVRLDHFGCEFLEQLSKWHGDHHDFQEWHAQFRRRTDFRIAIVCHANFLRDQAYSIDAMFGNSSLWEDIPVRNDIRCTLSEQPKCMPENETVVTPYVHKCFQTMPWERFLHAHKFSLIVESARQKRIKALNFPVGPSVTDDCSGVMTTTLVLERARAEDMAQNCNAGDLVAKVFIFRKCRVKPGKHTFKFSYAYVTEVCSDKKGNYLKVLRLRQMSDTVCRSSSYHSGRELFMSGKCNCHSQYRVRLSDMRSVAVPVTFFSGQPMGGDSFFMKSKYIPSEDCFVSLKQSDLQCRHQVAQLPASSTTKPFPTPTSQAGPKLKGLGLFSGCGAFDRGLEQSQAIRFVAAVEYDRFAVHSYAANRASGRNGLFYGSVNDHLVRVMRDDLTLAKIGDIDFISSGSPCQGFSGMHQNRGSDDALLKCSLLASAVSHIETYMPAYAILENVPRMGSGLDNACTHTMAALFGLGYQVRKLTLNSANFGSTQRRQRLFIIAAAPCLPLPALPIISHGTESDFLKPAFARIQSTGILSNNLQPFVTAGSVDGGLSETTNDMTINVMDPDHISGARQGELARRLFKNIPRAPKQMALIRSIQAGWQSQQVKDWLHNRAKSYNRHSKSRAFKRIDPDGFINTILTKVTPSDTKGGGQILHWDEHRTLTLLEARRAQGFPDDELLIGPLSQQWSQVGNAVARQVAAALGVTVRDSWVARQRHDEQTCEGTSVRPFPRPFMAHVSCPPGKYQLDKLDSKSFPRTHPRKRICVEIKYSDKVHGRLEEWSRLNRCQKDSDQQWLD